jgi:hypothetical protein
MLGARLEVFDELRTHDTSFADASSSAVIAVMALVPKTANAAKALRSTWIPAPPLESEPAMVSAVMVHGDYHES